MTYSRRTSRGPV